MPIDATVRHAFAYAGAPLLLADEHTLVTVTGNALQFASTVTPSQHFLLRNKPRKVLAFDVNWRRSEIAVTNRDPDPDILIYSYPDKKLKGKLSHGAAMEYGLVRYSRCGQRLLTVRADDPGEEGLRRFCVWDMDKYEPLKGCATGSVSMDVTFASFDPSNSDHVVLGGNDGLHMWKIYKGKVSYMMRKVSIKLSLFVKAEPQGSQQSIRTTNGISMVGASQISPAEQQDLDEKRKQLLCHAWMRDGRVLVANRAGELVVVDTTATATTSELTGVVFECATRDTRCYIAGIVYTTETIVIAYADGSVAWLSERDAAMLQITTLPCYQGISGSAVTMDPNANAIAAMAPSPNYSKVYVGTHDGHVYELKVSVAIDDDEEVEEDMNQTPHRLIDDPSGVASRLISSCGAFHSGPIMSAAILTPSGGTIAHDLVIVSGGNGARLCLWSVNKCRGMGDTNVVKLFAEGASALMPTTNDNGSPAPASPAAEVLSTVNEPPTPTVSVNAGASTPSTTSASGIDPGFMDSTSVVITALGARTADPILVVGDNTGKLRVMCVAKVVGGGGMLEFLPLHSSQLLPQGHALDLVELHNTQPFAVVASTSDRVLFVLSLDHEKHFRVLAYIELPTSDEHVLDVKWSVPSHSPAALSFTFFTTAGRLYLARYQDCTVAPGSSTAISALLLPSHMRPKVVAHGPDLLHKCANLRFLTDAPVNAMIAVSPLSNELLLLKYSDLVIDPNEKVPLQAKTLAVQDTSETGGGITAVAVYGQRLRNGEELLATVALNGSITIWLLSFSGSSALQTGELHFEDVQAAKKKTLVPHLGAITSLGFICISSDSGANDIYLVTTGLDGSVCLIDVRVSADMLGPPRPEPIMNPLYLNVTNYAKYENPFKPEHDTHTRPFLASLHEELDNIARNRFDRLKDKTRAQLNDLEMKLKILLAENEKLSESERLERDEFVINTEWRDRMEIKSRERAQTVRDGIVRDLARMRIVRERMKLEFWDSASVSGVKLRGLTPASSSTGGTSASNTSPLFVYNLPMRKLPKHEVMRTKRVELLRLIEYEHQKQELENGETSSPQHSNHRGTSAGRNRTTGRRQETALTRFHETVPSPLQWLIGSGVHHPAVNKWIADKLRVTSGKTDPVLASSPLLMPCSPPSTLNDVQSFHLVYHPAAVRTRKQQRIQIQLLKSYVRFLLVEFNREFEELRKLKDSKIEEVEAKNARIQEICKELYGDPNAGAGGDLFRPKWAPDERASSILEVKPEEMTQTPYESEEARKKREKEAAEEAELERQRQKDDVAGRALRDMMDGTLEVKKENLVSQTLVKEQWMIDTPLDEMTVEQKKLVAQFEAAQQKLKEEQEKYKKSLDLELKKTKVEIQDVAKAFDDKVRALQEVALSMKTSVLAQQLYELRLAEDLMEHESLTTQIKQTQEAMTTLQREIRICEKENDTFSAQVDSCKEEWHRAVEEDKILERGFVRELEDTVSSCGIVIEQDLLKHLVDLYKKRKGDDVRTSATGVGSIGATGVGGPKRGKSNMHLNPGGDSKQRLLAEATEQSSRSLAAATLLQNLQSSSGNIMDSNMDENNFDPFVGINLPPAASNTGGKPSSGASAPTRHVVALDYEVDRPDGLMIDDRVWRSLNELRTKKILAEYTVREKADQFSRAKEVAEELRVKLQELQNEYDSQQVTLEQTTQQLTAHAENSPLLVHIKQGQDETAAGDIFRSALDCNSQEALLVARSSVESLNDVIQLHGKDQVGILGKIKNFRKNINVMEWEHTLLEMQTRDMEERYTDIQLLRVTKDLQELFHTGDTTEKQKRELALLEAKMEHLGKHHQSSLLKLDKAQIKLEKQLRERMKENQGFAAQIAQLETQVQIREDILISRKSAALRNASPGSGSQAAGEENARLKAITVRRKLVDLARAQTEEIEYLRMELDKMRRRTFPTFAQHHAAAHHGGGVDSLY